MNYSYQSPQRLNTNPFAEYFAGLHPTQSMQRNFYDYEQNAGTLFQKYLSMMDPSLSQERTLRSMFPMMWDQYMTRYADNYAQHKGNYQFADFLAKDFDSNSELAKLSPSARNEDPRTFQRQVRWVAF